ncbi:PREDICTED: uncharacterized protein LOC108565682 [Nicrophorus vespilloides]|uniref:Uncharacterized protein LOC108565682 n=1 Tax=Nicrophorus vespilloides TaxID=110193 RepID=A0ABM1N1Q0_NICVS|nr:PREDICTED: uncharacterized protein LOC108565682 [Nicrophorus vespilloides]
MTDIENKLDEDFLFYLGFTSSFSTKVREPGDQNLVQQWLQKLCGQPCQTMEQKRNRNIFLSNLLLNMQDGALSEPFTVSPNEIDYSDATKYFQKIKAEIETPAWLGDLANMPEEDDDTSKAARDDGRTYVATRAMPNGEGAFAYVAISLAEEEPAWLGGGEGLFDQVMDRKYKEMVPEPNEMEIILARRKDTKERQRVLTFYDVMLQNIADELDGKITAEENHAISVVLEQLIADLQSKDQYEEFDEMNDDERRVELLLMLFDRTKSRRDKVATREEMLDDIEATLKASFFDASEVEDEDKYELPAAMWEYVINRPPNKKNMEAMQVMYPVFLVEKFMALLSDQKENIALRMQARHENIVTQMKKDLRKEGEKLRKWLQGSKLACDQAVDVLNAVKAAAEKQKISYEKKNARKKGGETEMTKMYNEMKNALFDTQNDVEDEAERGRILTEQINALNVQSEVYSQITECSIIKTEEANMEIMKNIKRMKAAVTQYENRIAQMRLMNVGNKKSEQMFIF